jgi:hypothetical protein
VKSKRWLLALVLALAALSAGATPCAPSATALCLAGVRFEVNVAWKDFQGRTGDGQAVGLTPDTGYFWFFSDSNIELIVKVLDARAINGKFWVFFGALSNVEYTLTVRDSVTGATKTYRNPSGMFASVGDTLAFEGSAGADLAVGETVEVEGTASSPESAAEIRRFLDRAAPASQAFTPCPDRTFGFDLTGCRFHIEVEWDDGHGNAGRGQPVQLTSDTGYFWFFSPSNVELMVKVLDARAINGKFWVFFGALSNVRYTVAVTDSVTGSVKTYVNPSGSFASVGDTAAFLGGRSVGPVRDAASAISAALDQTGGTIVAHGADGSAFTLEIPPDALDGPQTITMTPVSRIDRLPYSGGLVAGVELEPAGLHLLVPATLTIAPASNPTPPNYILTYAYARSGENLINYPRLDKDAIAIPILHFSGYGAGSGTAGDAAASDTPAGPLELYIHQYAGARFLRMLNLITDDELTERAIQIFTDAYNDVVVRQLNDVRESCDKAELELAMRTAFDFLRFIQLWGFGEDPRMEGFTPQVFDLADQILRACQQKAYDRCVSRDDPFEIVNMMAIARQLQLLGDEDVALTTFIENGLMESCLRFEIDFESKVVEEFHTTNGTSTTRMKYRAQHIPLRFNYAGNNFGRSIWEGGCTVAPELVEVELPVSLAAAHCQITTDAGDGWFNAAAAWIGVMGDPSASAVKLLYDPGKPTVTAKLVCSGQNPANFPVFQWYVDYLDFHHGEFSAGYGGALFNASNWEQLRYGPGPSQNGEFFAKKSYEREFVDIDTVKTEQTWFFLKHTPGAPMPDCPALP